MSVATAISNGTENARFHGYDLAATITAAGVNGHVVIPPNLYLLSAPITPLSGQRIELAVGAVLRHVANTSAFSLIDIDGVSDVEIVGGTIDGNVANQAVWNEQRHLIRIRDSSRITIRSRFINPIGDAVYISHAAGAIAPYIGSSRIDIDGFFVGTNLNRNGVTVVCGRGIRVGGFYYRMGRADMPGAIDLEPNDADDFLYDIHIDHPIIDNGSGSVVAEHGIQLANSTAGATIDGINIDHPIIRGKMLRGIRLRGHASVVERAISIDHPIIRDITPATGTNYGIRGDDIDFKITSPEIDGVTGVGINQTRCDLQLIGGELRNCTVAGYEHGNAAELCQVSHVKVRDCGIGFSLRSSNQHFDYNDIYAASGMTYGVIFNAGTNNKLTYNRAEGATTANFSGVGAQIKYGNIGFVSEAAGSGSILSGTTSIAITHGLGETPPSNRIRITLTNNPTNDPGIVWVDTVGATTFTVHCRSDPGVSNLNFVWEAWAD